MSFVGIQWCKNEIQLKWNKNDCRERLGLGFMVFNFNLVKCIGAIFNNK